MSGYPGQKRRPGNSDGETPDQDVYAEAATVISPGAGEEEKPELRELNEAHFFVAIGGSFSVRLVRRCMRGRQGKEAY